MSEANKALIRRWFEEVWDKGRAEAIDEMFAEDCANHGLVDDAGNPTILGPASFKAFHQNFRSAFPNITVTVEDVLAEGDKIAARCIVRGSHTGSGLGFAATDKAVEIEGIVIARIKDGKFVETWNNFDFLKMYRQLGAIG